MTQDLEAPLICPPETVVKDWIDYNGHLNMAFYNVIFDHGVDYLYDYLGIGKEYTESGIGSCFTLEAHVHYLNELSLGDEVGVKLQLVNYDSKRIHIFEEMYNLNEGYLAATSEQIGMHIDMKTRKSSALPSEVQVLLEKIMIKHSVLPTPEQLGHQIGIKQR
jgi:acyl-CoA thioester hydrolase